ncbi:MAG: glutathione S-transferase family protein [Acidiferrobacterales bacterium]|nr:glutathione S-transferase family protein [Acidiferrobacterales bacterium]
MQNIKLTYFDFHGGRAEPVRMALAIGKIEFEDIRVSFMDFARMRGSLPLKAVPVMEVDGVSYCESNAMTRYVGKLTGLYPDDPWQAFLCDEILEASEDVTVALVKTFGLEGDALKEARDKLENGIITDCLELFNKRLAAAGGAYFSANQLTVADLKVMVWLRALNAGQLDHVSNSLVASVAPELNTYVGRISQLPSVAKYLEQIS